ncbi:EamA family transporter RarD [Leeia oryzae]|uniref:EamA family transporter RarD n=1 Tax=Leeia oryzae TaxID=356662 RepID=UPI0012EA6136
MFTLTLLVCKPLSQLSRYVVLSKKGLGYGFMAYFIWGLFPLYWKPLSAIPAFEILAHRMVWSLVVIAILLTYRKEWSVLQASLSNRKTVLTFLCSSILLATNWGGYIWAVNNDMILECSLGYFMNPLVNVMLGALVLKEHLRSGQKLAIMIAAAGVVWLTIHLGHLPWIALLLALSFGLYGLIRKTASLNSLEGLSLETLLLAGPALLWLIWRDTAGIGHFGHVVWWQNLMLVGAGIVTTGPLLLFAAGARRLPLSTMGLLQYMTPTIQFFMGIWLYHEPFDHARLLGFIAIWCALALYTMEGLWQQRKTMMAAMPQ